MNPRSKERTDRRMAVVQLAGQRLLVEGRAPGTIALYVQDKPDLCEAFEIDRDELLGAAERADADAPRGIAAADREKVMRWVERARADASAIPVFLLLEDDAFCVMLVQAYRVNAKGGAA